MSRPDESREPIRWPAMKTPPRVIRTQLPPGKEALYGLLICASLMIPAGMIAVAVVNDRLWLIVPALAAGIGGAFWSTKLNMRAIMKQIAIDSRRLEEIAPAESLRDAQLVVSRRMPLGWPIFLTVILLGPAGLLIAGGDHGLGVFLLMIAGLIVLVTWLCALRLHGVIVKLTPFGIEFADSLIAWHDVSSLHLGQEPRSGPHYLSLRLITPMPVTGLMSRINSFLSRGASRLTVYVSLRRADERPAVIYSLANELWRNAVGRDVANAALRARIEQLKPRPWRTRPIAERRRTVRFFLAFSAWVALAIYGGTRDFIISDAWRHLSMVLATLLTFCLLIGLARVGGLKSVRNDNRSFLHVAMFVLVALMLSAATWIGFGLGLPDSGARLLGQAQALTVTMRREPAPQPRDCPYRVGGYVFESSARHVMCVPRELYERLPDEGPMLLHVRRTWFGIHVDYVEAAVLK